MNIEAQQSEFEMHINRRLRNNVPARMNAINDLIEISQDEENEHNTEATRILYLTAAGNSIKNSTKYDPMGSRTMDIRVRATEGLIKSGIVSTKLEVRGEESPFISKYRKELAFDSIGALENLRKEMHIGGNGKDLVGLLAEVAMKHEDEEVRNIALGNLTTNITALRVGIKFLKQEMPMEYTSDYIIKSLVNHREDKPVSQIARDEKVNNSFDIMSLVANGVLNQSRMVDLLNSSMTNEQILKRLDLHMSLLPNIQQLANLRASEFYTAETGNTAIANSIESLLKFSTQEDLFAALTIMGKSLSEKEEIRNIILNGLVDEIEKIAEFNDDVYDLINLFTSINDNFRGFVGSWDVKDKKAVIGVDGIVVKDDLKLRVEAHSDYLVMQSTHDARYSLKTPSEPHQ